MTDQANTDLSSSAASIEGLVERLEQAAEQLERAQRDWQQIAHLPTLSGHQQNLIDLLREAAALLRPSRPSGERWQPIETAPTDGTPVLLWEPEATCRHDGIAIIGSYTHFEVAPAGYHSGWYDDVQGHYEIHPTHWMPLPVSPVPERRGADQ